MLPAHPHPARECTQRPPSDRAPSSARSNKLCATHKLPRAPRSQTRHVPYSYRPYYLTDSYRLPFGDGTGLLRMLARAFQSLKCSQSPKFSKCQNFKRLTFSEFSWTQAEPARLDSTPRPTHAPTAPRKGGGGAGLGGPLPAHVGRVRRRPRRLPSRRPRTCMLPAPNPRTPRVYPTVARCPRVQSPPGASLVDAGLGPPGGGCSAGIPHAVSRCHTSGSVLQVPNRGTHIYYTEASLKLLELLYYTEESL